MTFEPDIEEIEDWPVKKVVVVDCHLCQREPADWYLDIDEVKGEYHVIGSGVMCDACKRKVFGEGDHTEGVCAHCGGYKKMDCMPLDQVEIISRERMG